MIGQVIWFNDSKGYGFIESEGQSYFAHFREIDAPGFKILKKDQNVSFEPGTSDKGLVAKSIKVVS